MTRRAVPNGPIAHAVAITVVLARIHLRTDTDERSRETAMVLENMHVHNSRGKSKSGTVRLRAKTVETVEQWVVTCGAGASCKRPAPTEVPSDKDDGLFAGSEMRQELVRSFSRCLKRRGMGQPLCDVLYVTLFDCRCPVKKTRYLLYEGFSDT
jgi:hypothetical protein